MEANFHASDDMESGHEGRVGIHAGLLHGDGEASPRTPGSLDQTLQMDNDGLETTLRSSPPPAFDGGEVTPCRGEVPAEVRLDEPLVSSSGVPPEFEELVQEDLLQDATVGIAPAMWKGCLDKLGAVNQCYSRQVVKRPCCMILVYVIGLAALLGLAWRPFLLETDFSAFIKADGRSQREREAYLQALEDKVGFSARRRLKEERAERASANEAATANLPRRLARECNKSWSAASVVQEEEDDADIDFDSWPRLGEALLPLDDDGQLFVENPKVSDSDPNGTVGRRLQSGVVYTKKELTILYIAKEGNALNERVLRVQRDLEQRLRNLQGWINFCIERGNAGLSFRCDPGETLSAFAWPSVGEVTESHHTHSYIFDGRGADLLQPPALLAFMQLSPAAGADPRRYFTKEFQLPSIAELHEEVPTARGLRTKYTFTIAVSRQTDAGRVIDLAGVNADYEKFILDEVYPVLTDSSLANEPAHIYYEGDVITGYEIEKTLFEDLMWAIGSITFVFCYMWAHTKRFYLSICALLIIFAAVPVGYVLTPVAKTTIASFLSVFLITGVGSDVVFVFTDFWDQSRMVYQKPSELHLRVAFMISHAGKSCLATSLTTAVSFFANLASALQPLREFGLFMGLCVMGAYVLVLLLLPPLIVLRCRSRHSEAQVLPVDATEAGAAANKDGDEDDPAEAEGSQHSGRPWIQIMLFNLTCVLGRGKNAAIVVTVTVVSCIAFSIGTALNAELDQGVPEIFPEHHNQVQVDEWTGEFTTVSELSSSPFQPATICSPNSSLDVDVSRCTLHWCEADPETLHGTLGGLQGGCYHAPSFFALITENTSVTEMTLPSSEMDVCTLINWNIRVASAEAPPSSRWTRTFADLATAYASTFGRNASSTSAGAQATELRAIGLEDWERGQVDMTRFFQMGPAQTLVPAVASQNSGWCSVETLCYFGAPACVWRDQWSYMGPLTLEEETTTTAQATSSTAPPSRRIQEAVPDAGEQFGLVTATVPANKRIDVTVVWGLKPPLSTPLVGALDEQWTFDAGFKPQNPWSQRAMASMCDTEALPIGLRVVEAKCWIDRFKRDLSGRGERFPTRNFDAEVRRWFPSTIEAAANIWIVDGVMAANKFTFYVDVDETKSSSQLVDYKKIWDEYVNYLNGQAGITANHAFHTAEVWVRAEAEVAIVGSTVETIIIAAVCAWVGVLFFTGDPILAFIVLGLVLGIISGLAFFMVCVMGWKIGPVEVISLVVFVGYSVTYSLHIAHNFAEVKEDSYELMILEAEARRREEERRLRLTGIRLPGSPDAAAAASAPEAHGQDPQDQSLSGSMSRQESPQPSPVAVAASAAARQELMSPDASSHLDPTSSHPDAQGHRGVLHQTGSTQYGSATTPPRRFSVTLRSLRQLSSDADPGDPSCPKLLLTPAEMRRARTRVAVLHVGGATLSSSLSTFGCSCFLLFCTLTIFDKLGAVVIAVTTLSIVFALVALPSSLMLAGPARDPCYKRALRQRLVTGVQRVSARKNLGSKDEGGALVAETNY